MREQANEQEMNKQERKMSEQIISLMSDDLRSRKAEDQIWPQKVYGVDV